MLIKVDYRKIQKIPIWMARNMLKPFHLLVKTMVSCRTFALNPSIYIHPLRVMWHLPSKSHIGICLLFLVKVTVCDIYPLRSFRWFVSMLKLPLQFYHQGPSPWMSHFWSRSSPFCARGAAKQRPFPRCSWDPKGFPPIWTPSSWANNGTWAEEKMTGLMFKTLDPKL